MKNFIFRVLCISILFNVFFLEIQAQNSSPNEKIEKADSLWSLAEYDKAILMYEDISSDYPDKVKFREKLIKAYAYLGMFDKAKERTGQLYHEKGKPYSEIGENCRLGLIYTMQNRTEDALKAVADMMMFAEPGQYFPGAPTCAMYFETPAGEYEKAAKKIYKIIEQAPDLLKLQYTLYAIYLEKQLGNLEKSNALLAQLEGQVNILQNNGTLEEMLQSPEGFIYYRPLAAFYALKGEDDMALDLLQKNYENGGRQYYWIKNVSPFFDQYEDNPRFVSLMKEMKMGIDKMSDNVKAKL
ncbi:MAG TPA: hypothetical protein VJ899_09810 [Salegentibacter sp.]|nr:hypothetical protein [Salegentibacter sp.]